MSGPTPRTGARRDRRGGRETATNLPLRADLGVLGRKWSLRIVADLGFRGFDRFSEILHSNPGLTPRVLSRRLRELEAAGLVRRRSGPNPRQVRWALTEQGADALPAVMTLLAYTSRWHANYRYDGRLPRVLSKSLRP